MVFIAYLFLTSSYVHAWYDGCSCYDKPTPTESPYPSESIPTPTVEISQVPQSSGGSGGNAGNDSGSSLPAPALPPQPIICTIPFTAPVLTLFQTNGIGSVKFSWMESETNIQKFSMVYGYSLDSLIYGIDNIPGSPTGPGVIRSIDIRLLQPNKNVWDVVTAWQNGCPESSLPLDPLVK